MAELRIVVQLTGDTFQLTPADQPLLYADDLAAIRGDGIFETLLLRGDKVRNVTPHFARFETSAQKVELPAPNRAQWEAATQLAVAEFRKLFPLSDAAVRWNYSRGRETTGETTAWISVAAFPDTYEKDRQRGIRVITGERGFRRDIGQRAPWALAGAKTLSYAVNMAAMRYAKANGADDMIFLDDEGYVLEGPTSTVLIVRANELITPPVEAGILAGTTQQRLFAVAAQAGWEVSYQALRKEDLGNNDGLYVLSSGRLATWVRLLDGVELARPQRDAEIQQLAIEAIA